MPSPPDLTTAGVAGALKSPRGGSQREVLESEGLGRGLRPCQRVNVQQVCEKALKWPSGQEMQLTS